MAEQISWDGGPVIEAWSLHADVHASLAIALKVLSTERDHAFLQVNGAGLNLGAMDEIVNNDVFSVNDELGTIVASGGELPSAGGRDLHATFVDDAEPFRVATLARTIIELAATSIPVDVVDDNIIPWLLVVEVGKLNVSVDTVFVEFMDFHI